MSDGEHWNNGGNNIEGNRKERMLRVQGHDTNHEGRQWIWDKKWKSGNPAMSQNSAWC